MVWRGLSVEAAARWVALLEAEAVRAAGIDARIDEQAIGVRVDELDALIGAAVVNNTHRPAKGDNGGVVTYDDFAAWDGKQPNPRGFPSGSGGGVDLWSPYRVGVPVEEITAAEARRAPSDVLLGFSTGARGRRRPLKLDGDDLRRRTYAVCHPTDLETPQPLEGASS